MKQKRSNKKYWVHNVKTVSTFPPEGTFAKDAKSIARIMASKKVSPKGIGSGIRMIQYFINRGGKGISATQRRNLEEAKRILQEKSRRQKRKEHAESPH
jgi:tRNA(adenine34) deaminase